MSDIRINNMFIEAGLAPVRYYGFEASPIYQSVTVVQTWSGSYNSGSTSYTWSGTQTRTFARYSQEELKAFYIADGAYLQYAGPTPSDPNHVGFYYAHTDPFWSPAWPTDVCTMEVRPSRLHPMWGEVTPFGRTFPRCFRPGNSSSLGSVIYGSYAELSAPFSSGDLTFEDNGRLDIFFNFDGYFPDDAPQLTIYRDGASEGPLPTGGAIAPLPDLTDAEWRDVRGIPFTVEVVGPGTLKETIEITFN